MRQVLSEHVDIDGDRHIYLMAEDSPQDAEIFASMIERASNGRYQIVHVDCFEAALEALKLQAFSALILDFNLSDRSGLDNIKLLSETYPELPVIILTGADDPSLAMESLRFGAQDCLSKDDISPSLFIRALHYAKQRKKIELELKQALIESADQNLKLETASKHDFLTQLPNRSFFEEVGEQTLQRASRLNMHVALLYFDLNGFKKINDSYGHSAGDQLLQQVAQRVKGCLRDYDLFARIGGDEFVVMTDLLEDGVQAYSVAKRIYGVIKHPFKIGRHELHISSSIGIATYPESNSLDLLLRHSDIAMYEAKQCKDHYAYFYTNRLEQRNNRNVAVERCLPQGVARKEFTTLYQPIINIKQPQEVGIEALIRWNSAELGLVEPEEFIPIAETTTIIDRLSESVLQSLADTYRFSQEQGIPIRKLSVNICAKQLSNVNFSNWLLEMLETSELPSEITCIEITERQFIENAHLCHKQLEKLRDAGVRIALDDFGTGFSSFTHLLELPIDILKLDGKLIAQIDQLERNQALTAGIIEMAHRLDMSVTAEGVEREEEYQMLESLGCDHAQGFWIARPMPRDALVVFLREWYGASNASAAIEVGLANHSLHRVHH